MTMALWLVVLGGIVTVVRRLNRIVVELRTRA
jgi:hypothetical protein